MMGSNAFPLWMGIHGLFALVLLVGLVAVTVWMARFANKNSLKMIVWVTLVVGVLGSLLTTGYAFEGMREMMQWRFEDYEYEDADEDYESMQEIREEMMDFDDEDETEEAL